ncbi:MAG: FAD-dependent oxidoreductase [bacterium]
MAYRRSFISCLLLAGLALFTAAGMCQAVDTHVVNESGRGIPVATTVDVVVVGGGSGAVAAAVAAAQAGASVFVVAPCPYLGEDLAGTFRLWLEDGEQATGALATSIFGTTGNSTPGNVKKVLNDALVAAKVDSLYTCYATDILTDGDGKPCGIVMANRSGRQAVIAKVVIDATENATVARVAGAAFTPAAPGPVTVKWVTITKKPRADADLSVRKLDIPIAPSPSDKRQSADGASWYEYTLHLNLPDGSWAARARLEQEVRDKAYDATQLYSADVPFFVPTDAIVTAHPAVVEWAGAAGVALDSFRPASVERLWVLGGCAGLSRANAEKLLRPLVFMDAGTRIGKAAAEEAAKVAAPAGVHIARVKATDATPGEVKELAFGIRPYPQPALVQQEQGALPVLGSYDVVVVGGGTAGAPAGIGAARQGASTLVIEYLHGLGGVGTLGLIGGYWHGNRVGFTAKIPEKPLEKRMEWYRHELRAAHSDIWFGTLGCGALVDGNRVTGVVVSTPQGRGVVLAKTVIDATGNSDIPIAAGAGYVYVNDPNDIYAMQAAHLPMRNVGDSYNNGNRPPTTDANPLNATNVFKGALNKKSFDIGQLLDSRERRRIVGDYTLDWLDIVNKRTFSDSIELAKSNYDSHNGTNTHVYFKLRPRQDQGDFWSYVPYRCLLPKGWDDVLVVGLGMSAHRDAMPIVRMQPDMQNQGYAAGVAAAMSVKAGVTPRQVDVKALQHHLVEVGNIKAEVLTQTDSYPLPDDRVQAAIGSMVTDYKDVEVLLAQPEKSLPLLRKAYEGAAGAPKVTYATVLGLMGDSTGVPTLLEAVKTAVAPEQGRIIAALGAAHDRRAIPALVVLLGQRGTLKVAADALGQIGDPEAATPLAACITALSQKPATPKTPAVKLPTTVYTKNPNLLTSIWALWRCGDKDNLAKTMLESIAAEDTGLYAQMAFKLLNERPKVGG